MLQCAFSERDITPPLGSIIPGDFKARYSCGVSKPLMTRVMVAGDGDNYTALAVVDACGLYADVTQEVRTLVARSTPIRPEAVMVMATHTHSGGPTLNWGEEVVLDPAYTHMIAQRTAEAMIQAYSELRQTKMKFGASELEGVSFVRIYRMKDGGLKTNPKIGSPDIVEPACEIDRGFSVAFMEDENGPAGALINFALHPAIVGGNKSHGDFISSVDEEMKRRFGARFVTLFINGACGNINSRNVFESNAPRGGRHEWVGKKIAELAAQLYEEGEETDGTVSFASAAIRLRRRKASVQEVAEAVERLESYGDELAERKPGTPGYGAVFAALEAVKSRASRVIFTETELQAVKIGGLHIYGVPAQIFCEYGVEIKKNAPFAMVSAFANDYIGYIPTPECMRPGVYEARLAATSCHVPEAGQQICEEIKKLHRAL